MLLRATRRLLVPLLRAARLITLRLRTAERLRVALRAWRRKNGALLGYGSLHGGTGGELDGRGRCESLRMFANDLLRHLQNLALATVGEFAMRFVQRKPEGFANFIAHVRADLAEASGGVEIKIEADGLGDLFAASP
jgi:hypothetical protein